MRQTTQLTEKFLQTNLDPVLQLSSALHILLPSRPQWEVVPNYPEKGRGCM